MLIKTELTKIELEKTLDFFRQMGFSNQYVEQLKRDLLTCQVKQPYVQSIINNTH